MPKLSTNRHEVSLRIWHPSIEPEDITRNLNLRADIQNRPGEIRQNRMGNPIPNSGQGTYWVHEYASSPHELETNLERIMQHLLANKSLISEISQTGGRCELFVGIFLGNYSMGLDFRPELMSIAAELNIHLALDLYSS
ncbi:DUF4279 domain-containing protein [Chitinibacter tainanensis]|uniref:DUF4279 domain-containing protein n=1 Tax=Chitinibacter tainanensis TaxID=230667 RepID=UPI003570CD8C